MKTDIQSTSGMRQRLRQRDELPLLVAFGCIPLLL